MPKKIWDTVSSSRVESSPGSKIVGDYFGLHKPAQATPNPIQNLKHSVDAQHHLERTTRRALNTGTDFVGFLASRKVDHVTLHIGTHPVYGISAYAERPTSHADGRIEVLVAGANKPVTLSRAEFFGQLIEEPLPDARIEEFCRQHWYA